MTATVTKADVERELLEAWEALGSAVDSFSDMELEQPGVVEGWSIKDLLGHIAFWAQQAAHNLQLMAAGRADEVRHPSDEKVTDEWNEREWRLRRERPLSEIREEWLASFRGAMKALAASPSEKLEEKLKGYTALKLFAVDTYEHYNEHLAQLTAWRRELETTET
ncbi:MAG: maleylpyruvate isomerase N-terminal domain-containing protein [Chloroflexi bacterium]|nr:maleylpyruvate isomerase N-terminal domain-containing protein [Chloroflexota bacterium]